ncbi:ATP-binding cassette domain-containing protein [Acetobacteraceae bacterium H6797]|nr:ATP-binding cassette domain-containing protein [Acetobacteraceae bacterium H6797]
MLELQSVEKRFDLSAPLLRRLVSGEGRRVLRAVDGVSLAIPRGTTLALVGESGSGKSTLARLAVGLHRAEAGRVLFDGLALDEVLRNPAQRRRLQMIFQDPYASLNPRWRAGAIIAEPLRLYRLCANRAALRERVAELLAAVGLAAEDAEKYPHEFSGGQRQRISIARALASNPDFLVCDEPTSALDVSVQAQIINLMGRLQRELGLTYLFISHNLAVVRQVSDRVGVVYGGRLVELAEAEELFATPRHPYTAALLAALPDPHRPGAERQIVGGEMVNPLAPPEGCGFHPRCPLATPVCRRERPALRAVRGGLVACHAAA